MPRRWALALRRERDSRVAQGAAAGAGFDGTDSTDSGDRPDVFTYSEDCNTVLLSKVFPRADYGQYKRALCLLDPYNIDLTWEVIETAGKARSVEVFMNFMIMDVNRNALRKNPDKSIASKVAQMPGHFG